MGDVRRIQQQRGLVRRIAQDERVFHGTERCKPTSMPGWSTTTPSVRTRQGDRNMSRRPIDTANLFVKTVSGEVCIVIFSTLHSGLSDETYSCVMWGAFLAGFSTLHSGLSDETLTRILWPVGRMFQYPSFGPER